MKIQTSPTTMIETGVMVMKDGKGWGITYEDGHSTCEGWMPATEASIRNPEFCKKPTDVTYKGSHYIKELETATLVPVVRKTEISIGNYYQSIPTEDWSKYPETKPDESGYYLTTYLSENLYYKCIYWDNQIQEWIWKQPFEVGCFVKKTKSKHYTECLSKLQELYHITIC